MARDVLELGEGEQNPELREPLTVRLVADLVYRASAGGDLLTAIRSAAALHVLKVRALEIAKFMLEALEQRSYETENAKKYLRTPG